VCYPLITLYIKIAGYYFHVYHTEKAVHIDCYRL